jgi:hypothetical protein
MWLGANKITWPTLTCLRDGFGKIFLEYFHKSPKTSFKILENLKYSYVEVYVKEFKKYFIFKSFETHLQVFFMFKSNHYNI